MEKTMTKVKIKTQVLNKIIKKGNKRESRLAKLFLQLENEEISVEEFTNETKNVTTKEMIRFSELWQKAFNSIIISELENLKERVKKLENNRVTKS